MKIILVKFTPRVGNLRALRVVTCLSALRNPKMNGLQIQGYLGLAIGAAIVLIVATETIQLYPEPWDFSMAKAWYTNNFNYIATAGILYYPVIFG